MTARLIELADLRGWKVNAPRNPELRGGTVAIDMPNSQEVCQELLKRDVLVDFRPKAGVRFSPHFYNTMEEIDRAIHTVDQILAGMAVAAKLSSLDLKDFYDDRRIHRHMRCYCMVSPQVHPGVSGPHSEKRLDQSRADEGLRHNQQREDGVLE